LSVAARRREVNGRPGRVPRLFRVTETKQGVTVSFEAQRSEFVTVFGRLLVKVGLDPFLAHRIAFAPRDASYSTWFFTIG